MQASACLYIYTYLKLCSLYNKSTGDKPISTYTHAIGNLLHDHAWSSNCRHYTYPEKCEEEKNGP